MHVRNALVVGGQKRCWEPVLDYLTACNVQIFDHWPDDTYLSAHIPKAVDVVITIASQVSHKLSGYVKKEAEKRGTPVIYTSHKFSKFPEDLKKWGIEPQLTPKQEVAEQRAASVVEERTTPLIPIDTVKPVEVKKEVETIKEAVEPKETKTEVVPMANEKTADVGNKRLARAQAKLDYVRELLKENPYMPPPVVIAKVQGKFPGTHPNRPGGLAKQLIQEIRLKEYGVRCGPAGRFFDKKGKLVEVPEKYRNVQYDRPEASTATNGARRPEANVEASNDRIKATVTQLRQLMAQAGIVEIDIPAQGNVRVQRSVAQDLAM